MDRLVLRVYFWVSMRWKLPPNEIRSLWNCTWRTPFLHIVDSMFECSQVPRVPYKTMRSRLIGVDWVMPSLRIVSFIEPRRVNQCIAPSFKHLRLWWSWALPAEGRLASFYFHVKTSMTLVTTLLHLKVVFLKTLSWVFVFGAKIFEKMFDITTTGCLPW